MLLYSGLMAKLQGAGWTIELLAGPTLGSLSLVATTSFSSKAPGYFSGGVVTIPNVPSGSNVWCVVRVYSPVTWNDPISPTTKYFLWGLCSVPGCSWGRSRGRWNPAWTASSFAGFIVVRCSSAGALSPIKHEHAFAHL